MTMGSIYPDVPPLLALAFLVHRYRWTSSGCWEWTDRCYSNGYGYLRVQGRNASAHRVSWEAWNGPIPDGLWVLHGCDNRRCINARDPRHLHLGTHRDNMREMVERGRWHRIPVRSRVRGERHPQAKLTEDIVRSIRRRSLDGTSSAQMAREFGVTRAAIRFAVKGRTWRHVE